MSKNSFTISWIYGEFRITRMQRGYSLERWLAPFPVHDLLSLNKALMTACEHMDLSKGGDLTIAYEDDLHTHEFFDVPVMSKPDLNKYLQRKVEATKPFKENAAWCFHEAKHSDDEEGILLHIMPQHIVDAIVRVCQEFYLTPRQLLPLSEIVSNITPSYGAQPTDLLIIVALFSERVEILVSLGNGEILFVRELPYSGLKKDHERLIIDINRTIRYAKQKYKKPSDNIWLIGEEAENTVEEIKSKIEGDINFDPNGLDPFYWASEVSNIQGELNANFIPLLARKKLNRTFFYRIALWCVALIFISTVVISSLVEFAVSKQSIEANEVNENIDKNKREIKRIESLITASEVGQQRLNMLSASNRNLPALFVNRLGEMLPSGLTLNRVNIIYKNNFWLLKINGTSHLDLQSIAQFLEEFESKLQSTPWNITIDKSWKESWIKQLKLGSNNQKEQTTFEIFGKMK